MRIAYLVMTHENPAILQRTIRTLSFNDDGCAFYIHVDKKANFAGFDTVRGRDIHFIDRIPVHWGEYSQVDAHLALVKRALESPAKFDYLVLITGSCYPLRTGGYIRDQFAAHFPDEYMDIVHVPGPGKPLSRFTTLRYPHEKPVRRFLFRALARFGMAERDYKKYLGPLEPYSGDGAWALTRAACELVVNTLRQNTELERFFRNTFAPDEAAFHTILGNSEFLPRMRRNPVYAVWPGPTNGHPALIAEQQIQEFESVDAVTGNEIHGPGELFFARKFKDNRLDLVDRVDAMIERKERVKLPPVSGFLASLSGSAATTSDPHEVTSGQHT